MAVAVALDDVIKNREKRAVPGRTGSSTIFLGSRDRPDFPHARLAEQDPGRYTKPHFHERDQFQIVIDGKGKFGRHEIGPYGVHFTRAYTPYGPLIADPEKGMKFIVLRTKFDPGSFDVPDERERLMRVADRNPWHVTRQATFPPSHSETRLEPIPDVRDDQGLAAYTLRMKANTRLHAPSAANSEGQYLVVVKGSVLQDNRAYAAPAVVFVWPHETAYQVHSGPAGLDALVLNFPHARGSVPAADIRARTSLGLKRWKCALCEFVYDEAAGMPEEGIAPGTRWEDVPETWTCPDCGASKSEFLMVEQER